MNVKEILAAMRGRRILVIGDMVADVYLDGRISRISREAPVLVLKQAGERVVAGGAANVMANAATLGGASVALGVVGTDRAAEGLLAILRQKGVDTDAVYLADDRPTATKTRIIAGGRATVSQQIVRVDRESDEPLSAAAEEELIARAERLLATADGVILSDYGSGAVTEHLRRAVIDSCRAAGRLTMVDSRYDVGHFTGIGYVKQNDAELAAAVGYDCSDRESATRGARELREALDADGVLVTRGERGMILAERDGRVTDIPVTDKSEVFDVSGAGDTCVATMMLALTAGAAPADAARLSNVASGIAVRKLGTATVTAAELERAATRELE